MPEKSRAAELKNIASQTVQDETKSIIAKSIGGESGSKHCFQKPIISKVSKDSQQMGTEKGNTYILLISAAQ